MEVSNGRVPCLDKACSHPCRQKKSMISLTQWPATVRVPSLFFSKLNCRMVALKYSHMGSLRITRACVLSKYQSFIWMESWKQRVENQWDDFKHAHPFAIHVVRSQPAEPQPGIHVIVRPIANPANSHYLLVDQIDESPLDRNDRTVVAVSPQPNGYELMLAKHNDINTVSPRTIIKLDNIIWPLHRVLPAQDGQYWRILHDFDEDHSVLLQDHIAVHRSIQDNSPNNHPGQLHEAHSLHSHVSDRWCGGRSVIHGDHGEEVLSFMQQHALSTITAEDDEEIEISEAAWDSFCAICLLSPEDPDQSWTLMSHGLLQEHYDSRPVEVSVLTLQSVTAALRAVWEDVPHRARLHVIRPNPEDGPYAHIILEFVSFAPPDPMAVPILRRIFRNGHPQCESAFHFETAHAYDLYDQAGLFTICSPWADHECRLLLNGIQLRENLPLHLRPGSLLDIHVRPLQDGTVDHSWNIGDFDNADMDVNSLMQSMRPSRPQGTTLFQFYHLENENFQVVIEDTETRDLETVVENARFLPTDGPTSIRTFHWVSSPPNHINGGSNVYIMELRGDSPFRLMNDDVLCLYEITIEQTGPNGDGSSKTRVLWTPGIASRERILFHLRVADLCRTKDCHISVNGIIWHEHDSVIRHFRDGDSILLRIKIDQSESILSTRCDLQSYEATERQRRVFTNSSGSDDTGDSRESPTPTSVRSRSRGGNRSASDDLLADPVLTSDGDIPDESAEPEEEEEQSLLQLARPRVAIELQRSLPSPSIITCDFTPVREASTVIEGIPCILLDFDSFAALNPAFEAVRACVDEWQGELPHSYHLYTDGSFHKNKPDIGGCGVVLIVNTDLGPKCGGVLSRTCRPLSKAHSSESIAMLWATCIAAQLSSFHQQHFHGFPFFLEFGFDAQVAGQQCAGTWTSFQHPLVQRFSRNLIYLLQHRHGFQSIQWTHIRAHQRHLWNETADLLANHALKYPDMVQPSDLLYVLMDNEPIMTGMDWIWALEQMEKRDPSLPSLFGDHLYHFRYPVPLSACTTCHFGIASGDEGISPDPLPHLVELSVATYNVLTLETRKDKWIGTGHTGRHLSLLKQCDEHCLHIVGVQETRALKTTNRINPYYHIVTSPCRADGHYGVQIWLHHSRPFADGFRSFKEDDYRIVWATPNVLAIKVIHPALHCLVIAARAPTSDKPLQELKDFWNSITSHVIAKFPGWKMILLCDSNSHVGSCVSTSISSFGSEPENPAGEVFHDWLLRQQFWLPSTWENVHQGDHFTYVTPNGLHQHRLDFVGLSQNWHLDLVTTSVAHSLDGSLSRCDHFAAVCHFKAKATTPPDNGDRIRKGPSFDQAAAADFIRDNPLLFADIANVPWHLNVHCHATDLATATMDFLSPLLPRSMRKPRKRHLGDFTWSILNWKRQLRKHQLAVDRQLKFGPLREIFRAWRWSKRGFHLPDGRYSHWLKMLHLKRALLEHTLRRVQPLLQQMLKQDDAHYYGQLAARAGRIETEEGLRGLWKEVKNVLPRWKARRTIQRYDIDDELCQHFASLEAGSVTPFHDLFTRCIAHQNSRILEDTSQRYQLNDLPTLFEIEQTCRKTTLGRAAGLDRIIPEICRNGASSISRHVHNLVLKITCNQAEPVWYKGGQICPIYKAKGPLDDPASYRGVVLLDIFGKKFHAWLRGRLLPVLQGRRTPGQLGGLPSEQTMTGSHLLRVHGQLARSLHVSSAVIFVDVRAAFHHMLRELIFLQGEPGLHIDEVLSPEDFDLQALSDLLSQRCQSQPSDLPVPLRRLADDVHRHTWFIQQGTSIGKQQVVATVRGTRPGSPVADVGFNLLMSDILDELHHKLQDDELISSHLLEFPVAIPPITWVDDLAVPIVTMSPADLIPITRRVLQHIHQVFYGKGLQINYAKGKTEAVIMFRGPEADRHRLDFFSETQDTYITTSTDTHVFRVRAVASYKHLGVRFQMDADLDHELQCRLGQARTAFHEVRRPIFGNRHISCKARLQLLQSLVFSKLLYGSGTWYEVSRRVLQKLESAVMRYFRSVVGVGFWQGERLTDDDIRAKFQIPTLRTMVAVARLRFLKHVASHGHDYHRDLLIAERATTKGWLYEVEDDLRWMASCSDLSSMPVIPGSSDMWSPFFDWLRTSTPSWKSWIRRTMRMHYLRENLAGECKSFHAQMFQMLRDNGAVLHEPVLETDSAPKHACPECEALFDTATGVAVHRAKKHGIHCPIKDYVQSETCPGCLKHMWTSQRVIQHLRYRPNRCLDRVVAGRTPQGFQNVSLPPHLLKVKRLPAHRRAHGPLLPLPHERERTQVRERLRVCEAYGNDRDFWSPVSANLQAHANERLTAAAQKWLREDSGDGDQFISNLLDAIAGFPFPHLVSEKCVIKWIESVMWDAMADWPPDALHIVETVHLPFIQGIPLWAHQNERAHLTRLLQSTAAPINWDPMHFAPAPHPKKQRRATSVHTLYGQLAQDEARWKDIVMSRLPPSPLTKMHIAETYYVVHLYSGRRRKQDLQWYLESAFHAVAGSTRILSIDTAVDAMCDVNADETWSMLCELARSGRLLAIVLGPPCETWSSARHELLMDPHGNPLPGPRPLRSSFRPWGIDSLSAKEYRQIRMGMRLLLRGLLLSLMTVLSGGSAILEHPAQPKQTDRASIWRTAVVTLLLQSGLFRQFTFVQWKFGGVGIKPTTLLYGNIPRLPAIMKSKEDPSAIRPTTSLVGTSHDGSFRTGRAKEYPTGMNDALASCIADQWLPYLEGPLGVPPEERPQVDPRLTSFLNLLSTVCSEIREHQSWLSDYQGR